MKSGFTVWHFCDSLKTPVTVDVAAGVVLRVIQVVTGAVLALAAALEVAEAWRKKLFSATTFQKSNVEFGYISGS